MSSSDSDRDDIMILSGKRRRPIKLTLARRSTLLGMISKKKKFAVKRAPVTMKRVWNDSSSDEDYKPAAGARSSDSDHDSDGRGDSSSIDGRRGSTASSKDSAHGGDTDRSGMSFGRKGYFDSGDSKYSGAAKDTEEELMQQNAEAARKARGSQLYHVSPPDPGFSRHSELDSRMSREREEDDLVPDALFPHYGSGTRHNYARTGSHSAPLPKSLDQRSTIGRYNATRDRIHQALDQASDIEDNSELSLPTPILTRAEKEAAKLVHTRPHQQASILGEGAFASVEVTAPKHDIDPTPAANVPIVDTAKIEAVAPHRMTQEEKDKAEADQELLELHRYITTARENIDSLDVDIAEIEKNELHTSSLDNLLGKKRMPYNDAIDIVIKKMSFQYQLNQLKAIKDEQISEEQLYVKQLNTEADHPGKGAFSPDHISEIEHHGPRANRVFHHCILNALAELKMADYLSFVSNDPDQSNEESDEVMRSQLEPIRISYDTLIKAELQRMGDVVPSLKTNERYGEYLAYANNQFNEAQNMLIDTVRSLRDDVDASTRTYELKESTEYLLRDLQEKIDAIKLKPMTIENRVEDHIALMLLEQEYEYNTRILDASNTLLGKYVSVEGQSKDKYLEMIRGMAASVPSLNKLRLLNPSTLIDEAERRGVHMLSFKDMLDRLEGTLNITNTEINAVIPSDLMKKSDSVEKDQVSMNTFAKDLVSGAVDKVWSNYKRAHNVKVEAQRIRDEFKKNLQETAETRRVIRGVTEESSSSKSASTSAPSQKIDKELIEEEPVAEEAEVDVEEKIMELIEADVLINDVKIDGKPIDVSVSTLFDDVPIEDMDEMNLNELFLLSQKRVTAKRQTPADSIALLHEIRKRYKSQYRSDAKKNLAEADKKEYRSFSVGPQGRLAGLKGSALYATIRDKIDAKVIMFQAQIDDALQQKKDIPANKAEIDERLHSMKLRSQSKSKGTKSLATKL